MDPRPVIDHEELLDRLGGDTELIQEILELFVEERDRMFAAVDDAVTRGDAVALERSAHTVKGALLNIGAGPAAEVAAELERLGHGRSLDDAERCRNQLQAELERLGRHLQTVSV